MKETHITIINKKTTLGESDAENCAEHTALLVKIMHENNTANYGEQSLKTTQIQYEFWPNYAPFSFNSPQLIRFFNILFFSMLGSFSYFGMKVHKDEKNST